MTRRVSYNVAYRIMLARKNHNWPRKTLARAAGVSRSSVERIERSVGRVSWPLFLAVNLALGFDYRMAMLMWASCD